MDEKGNERSRAGTATCITVPREGTRGSGAGMVIVGLAEPLYGKGVEDTVGSATKNAGPQQC